MLLPEDRAWAFAMAFQSELHGRVKLVVDRDDMLDNGFDIVRSYRWIQIDFAGSYFDGVRPVVDRLRVAASARMASIVWFLLSRCPGYSHSENPVFWKRVMSELNRFLCPITRPQIADGPSANYFESVTDSIRFFDRPDDAFPSLRLEMKVRRYGNQDQDVVSDKTVLQVLCGNLKYDGEDELEAKMNAILKEMQPYLPTSIPSADLAIPVRVNADDPDIHTDAALVVKNDKTNLPAFVILAPSSPNACVSYHRKNCTRESFDAIFAELRTTKTIRSVTFDTFHHPMVRDTILDFDEADYETLGNALFHPDSADSSWDTLSIDITEVTNEKVAALQRMSLKTDVDGRAPLSTPCIRHLRVSPTTSGFGTGMTATSVLRLLSVLGQSLITLDILTCSKMDAKQVSQLLDYCPNLKALAINHDGSAWSRNATASIRLERLSLYLDSKDKAVAPFSDAALQTELSNLEALRVTSYYARFEHSRDVILRLLETHPTLSYFHWLNPMANVYRGRDMPNGVVPYETQRQYTKQRISANRTIQVSRNVTHRVPATTTSKRAAILSALDTKVTSTGMDRHVAESVMELATPRVPREICIDE